MTGKSIARAMLIGSDGTILNCQFNPETLSRSKQATWHSNPSRGANAQPLHQFVGTGSETLSAKLMFDDFDSLGSPGRPVQLAIGVLLDWLTVSAASQNQATPQPATITFQWGTGVSFKGFLAKVDVQYTMFSPDGRPVRATAQISMTAVPDTPKPTNPTSGGVSGRTSAQLGEGDSLASISYAQYGDPNLWRAIALANGVDDPGRITPGTRLLVPTRAEAIAMSAPGGSDV